MSTAPAVAFKRLAVSTAVVTYLLIIMGGIVRVTGSGLGCGVRNDWPLCNGALLPSAQPTAIIEFSHRWIAALATLLVVMLAISAWLTQRRHRRRVVAASVAAALFVVQIGLGALTVKYRLPGGVVMIHLANALLLLGVLVYIAWASVTTGTARRFPSPPQWLRRLTIACAGAAYLLALSGALVVERGAGAACAAWPLCGDGLQLPAGGLATINVVHRAVAAVVAVLIVLVVVAWLRRSAGAPSLRVAALLVVAVLALQIAAGALAVELQLPAAMRALHIALASGLWALVLLIAVGARSPVARSATATVEPASRDTLRTPIGAASL